MGKSIICLGILALCGNTFIQAVPFDPRAQGRYGQGDMNGANDAEVGQLSGIFNSLVNELQSAPKLAEGPQAQANREANERRQPPPPPPVTENPAATDAPPEDVATPDTKTAPVNSKMSRFADNGMNANRNPSGPFPGGNFGGNPMMYPPMQPNMGPGPYGNPFAQQNQYGGYGGGEDYQQQQPQRMPSGNPGSYGPDNAALQEQGLGQLGQFFSSMVGELQNSGFNNNVESAISPKRRPKPPVNRAPVVPPVAVAETTASSTKTTTASDDDKE